MHNNQPMIRLLWRAVMLVVRHGGGVRIDAIGRADRTSEARGSKEPALRKSCVEKCSARKIIIFLGK